MYSGWNATRLSNETALAPKQDRFDDVFPFTTRQENTCLHAGRTSEKATNSSGAAT
jgi:hypothetical protein